MYQKIKKVLSVFLVVALVISNLYLSKDEIAIGAADASSSDNLITNGSFDSGMEGWEVVTGSAITIKAWGASGVEADPALGFWLDEAYKSEIYQTIAEAEAGTYELSAYIFNDGAAQDCYMYAYQGTDIANMQKYEITVASSVWSKISMTIELPETTDLTVGFYKDSPANGWCTFDQVVLVKEEVVESEVLVTNGSFSEGLEGWTISEASNSAAVSSQGYGYSNAADDLKLSYWLVDAYTADTYQTITAVEAGIYELSAYIYNDGAPQDCYMYAYQESDIVNVQKQAITEASSGWSRISITIELQETTDLTIGFFKDSPANGWCTFDEVALIKTGDIVPKAQVVNGNFSEGLEGWSISDTSNNAAVIIQGNGYSNTAEDLKLSYWLVDAYTADTYQTIAAVEAGLYELSAYIYNDGAAQDCYMYAYLGTDTANKLKYNITEASSGWSKISLTITLEEVSDLTIGFYKDSPANGWCSFDEVTLTKVVNEVVGVPIINSGFEDGDLTGWTLGTDNSAGATYIHTSAKSGSYGLSTWSSSAYISDIYQDVTDVEPGYYYLTAYVQNSGAQNYVYLYGAGSNQSKSTTYIPVSSTWTLVTVRGIEVAEDGQVRIGIYSNANAGNWMNIDNLQLIRESNQEKQYKFLKGGDISFLNYMEDHGTKYYDKNGVEKDALQVLAEKGWNIVRMRLYNNPGKGRGDGAYYCDENYETVEDLLDLAKRAKEKGMEIQFSFHYSDYWTNGGMQSIPYEWQEAIEGKSDAEAVDILEAYMYSYTKDVMERLAAQGTTPEYVSLGNEMHGGVLFPYGTASTSNWVNLARFLKAAYNAIKEVSPSTQVILHLDDAGNLSKYTTFFDNCNAYGVNYDIIGPSYYPFWTNKTVAQIVDFCNTLVNRYDKDIMIMETGYNFADRLPSGSIGQLNHNGPYDSIYPSSPESHRDFMLELFNGLKSIKDGRCIGDLYWDPIMVEQPGIGWAMIEATDEVDINPVSNTTVFDFNHKALPILDAYEYNDEGSNQSYLYGKITGNSFSPIPKAYIQIGLDSYEVATDLYGDFYLPVSSADNVTVSISAPGYINGTSHGNISFVKGDKVKLDFILTGGGLSGLVLDQDSSPVLGALVTAKLNNQSYTAITDAEGNYIMHDLPAGSDYSVTAIKAGYEPSGEMNNVAVSNAQITEDCNLVITLNSGTIRGKVFDGEGNALRGATVTAVLNSNTFSTLTDANGEYLLSAVTAGANYIVTARKENYISESITVTLEVGEVKNQIDFHLSNNIGNLSGTVKDGNGALVDNATVELTSGKYRYTATTDFNGWYEFTNIPVRTYSISAAKDDLMKAELTNVEVKYHQTQTVNLTMPVFISMVNGSFEEAGSSVSIPIGWRITDPGSAIRQDRTSFQGTIDGIYALALWAELPFETDISQSLVDLENGDYVISIQCATNITRNFYMYAKDSQGNIIAQKKLEVTSGYKESMLEVTVTDKTLTVGFYANASGGEWAVIDMVQVGYKGNKATPTPTIPTQPPTNPGLPTVTPTPQLTPTPVVTPDPDKDEFEAWTSIIKDIKVNGVTAGVSAQETLYVGGTTGDEMTMSIELPDALMEQIDEGLRYEVYYKSSNSKVAAVSDDGKITALKKGKTLLITGIRIGNRTLTFLTFITVEKANIQFVESSKSIKIGESVTFKVVVYGYNLEDITWTTSKRDVAAVSKNVGKASVRVTGKTAGTDYVCIKIVIGKNNATIKKVKVIVTK